MRLHFLWLLGGWRSSRHAPRAGSTHFLNVPGMTERPRLQANSAAREETVREAKQREEGGRAPGLTPGDRCRGAQPRGLLRPTHTQSTERVKGRHGRKQNRE